MPPIRNPLRATVVVATYENPSALALVLAGLDRQTTTAFELLIADDGSREPTRELVAAFSRRARVPVRHLWQEDDGLRKGRILNRAIAEAAHDWILFLDGDVIPSADLVARHLSLARPGVYLSGSCVLLSPAASAGLTPEAVSSGALDGLRSVRPGNRRARRLVTGRLPGLATLLDRRLVRRPVGFHGGHASVARDDAIAVGGFDERLARFEDKDFGRRLRLFGVEGESVRHRARAWHVHHERPWATPEVKDASRALFEANAAAGDVRTAHGLPPMVRGPAAAAARKGE